MPVLWCRSLHVPLSCTATQEGEYKPVSVYEYVSVCVGGLEERNSLFLNT